jgi:hypothetical protein
MSPQAQEWNDWSKAFPIGQRAHIEGLPCPDDPSLSNGTRRGLQAGWQHAEEQAAERHRDWQMLRDSSLAPRDTPLGPAL